MEDAKWTGWMRFGSGSLFSDVAHEGGRNHARLDGSCSYVPWHHNTSGNYGLRIGGVDALEADVSGYGASGRNARISFLE